MECIGTYPDDLYFTCTSVWPGFLPFVCMFGMLMKTLRHKKQIEPECNHYDI